MQRVLRKRISLSVILLTTIFTLVACGSNSTDTKTSNTSGTSSEVKTEEKVIQDLKIAFVPSKNPDDIVSATEPLEDLLIKELKEQGYTVDNIDITVGTNFEAVGESLASGSADVGFGVPGGTVALYRDDTDVILTATRNGLNKDSTDPKDWNDGKETEQTSEQVTSYRSILIAGPSDKGQELAKKVNNGEKLSWDDLNSANWGVSSTTSSAGYIYPSLWLNENYKKNITELDSTVIIDSYGSGFARLASGQIDILPVYADARRDFQDQWTSEYGQSEDIWKTTNVIGVTPPIYNDAIIVSKESKIITDDFKKALSEALINLAKTTEGKKIIDIYSHSGYKEAKSSDYEDAFKAADLMKNSQ
ncbi:phosphate/phosphite/phosphonate ABC transporter substrate-binding protein [Enterococcus sp. HY326]|uniref:phosphate/phosphite/phosphonate ABC transporter substrate-binding protein n=1 Tax=Enterococcus sp. HY326 TaxID=2971265 RepID=UPI002240B133|nr:PhnD/SsuA/transferrin family substrate-binding protein [Enterococcus sp. HY326]